MTIWYDDVMTTLGQACWDNEKYDITILWQQCYDNDDMRAMLYDILYEDVLKTTLCQECLGNENMTIWHDDIMTVMLQQRGYEICGHISCTMTTTLWQDC